MLEKGFKEATRAFFALSGIAAVVSELSAGQDDFLNTVCLAGAYRCHHVVDRNAGLAAARIRDNAEGAQLVAALLDLDEGARAEVAVDERRATRRRVAPIAEALEDAVGYRRLGGVREDGVRSNLSGNISGRSLGVTAGQYDFGFRRKSARHADEMPRLAVSDLRHGAGVDDEGRSARDGPIEHTDAVPAETTRDDLRVGLVQLASESKDRNGWDLFAWHHQPS